MTNWKQITSHIYIGNIFSLVDKTLFENQNITNVISLVPNNPLKTLFPHVKIREHFFEDIDKEDIICHSQILYHEIERIIEANEKVLVHCNAGKSRSAGVVIYYLVKKYKKSPKEIYDFVKQQKPDIQPNKGFYKQLMDLPF